MSFSGCLKSGLMVMLALSLLPLSFGVAAQQAVRGADNEQPEVTTATYRDWKVTCINSEAKQCLASQVLSYEQGEQRGRLLAVSLTKTANGLLLGMEMPLGLDFRSGVALKIDDNEGTKLSFDTCLQTGCRVLTIMSKDLIAQFKSGTTMKVGFRAYGNKRPIIAEVSLAGSSAALNALPEAPPEAASAN